MKDVAWQVAGLLLVGALPAVATAWWHPRSPYGGSAAGDTSEASALADGEVRLATALGWGESVLWVDARPSAEYTQQRIPGAVWLSVDDWEAGLFDVLERVPTEGWVVVYCGSQRCEASREVAERLRDEAGLERVVVLHGGWDAWKAGPR
ncbi:MAG: rhodanese-like domain-containing protein [Planctomycetota bacterium]